MRLAPRVALLACLFFVVSFGDTVYWQASTPLPEPKRCRGYMGLPCPPDCSRFYNNGHHREWAACMGVPYE